MKSKLILMCTCVSLIFTPVIVKADTVTSGVTQETVENLSVSSDDTSESENIDNSEKVCDLLLVLCVLDTLQIGIFLGYVAIDRLR